MKENLLIFLIIIVFSFNSCYAEAVITNGPHWGRFGNQLCYYLHAKWLAQKYKLKFVLTPFKHSNELIINKIENHHDKNQEKFYEKKIFLKHENEILNSENSNTLFMCRWLKTNDSQKIERDIQFRDKIKKLVKPLYPQNITFIPSNRISIAIHIRRGGDYDEITQGNNDLIHNKQGFLKKNKIVSRADVKFPLKFPPIKFYIEQLEKLYNFLDHKQFFVFIFTDSKNPKVILEIFKNYFDSKDIIFDCRKSENFQKNLVVQDFWEMTKFNCLIRPESSLSRIAQLLGDQKIIIYPISSHWEGKALIIDEAKIDIRDTLNITTFSIKFDLTNKKLKQIAHKIKSGQIQIFN